MQNNCITGLLNIQGVKVKNIKSNQNSLDIFIETTSKLQKCPCCGHYTKHVHDYRIQKIQHILIGSKPSYLYLNKRRC